AETGRDVGIEPTVVAGPAALDAAARPPAAHQRIVVVFVGRRVAAPAHAEALRRLGLCHTRPARGRRAVGLIDELEERPQLVHVAKTALARAGRGDAIVAPHA